MTDRPPLPKRDPGATPTKEAEEGAPRPIARLAAPPDADRRYAAPPGIESTRLWTAAEVARMFRVDAKTVARWTRRGKLTGIRTPGRHLRYRDADVQAFIAAGPLADQGEDAG
ncbi:helix-turn-helix domain-containing protein [Nocardiopsis sediminis]|uniref:Helix-turn-helix domain-containing protein n=1 Tax=Nocardiopsis sediminis TaxID=1778267 RepID=A0ABV8FSZ5_9ACTN